MLSYGILKKGKMITGEYNADLLDQLDNRIGRKNYQNYQNFVKNFLINIVKLYYQVVINWSQDFHFIFRISDMFHLSLDG